MVCRGCAALWPLLLAVLCVLILTVTMGTPGFMLVRQQKLSIPAHMADQTDSDELNFGIIVDAGSSGSRVFVYAWPPHSGAARDLLAMRPHVDAAKRPILKKLEPGLSALAESPENATGYIRPLLDYAAEAIPPHKRKETSLFILATAGLRLLPAKQSEAIIQNLRTELPKLYDFIVFDQHIEMISGKWEGIYSWIAVNYALGRFTHYGAANDMRRPRTVGMIDMGGGSMQIAFEINKTLPPFQEHLSQTVNLGFGESEEHVYRLYVTTFLGFGANSAIQRYEHDLIQQHINRTNASEQTPQLFHTSGETASTAGSPVVKDPCLPVNLIKTVHLPTEPPITATSRRTPRTFLRKGVGQFGKCLEALKPLLKAGAPCEYRPCSINGVHQPSVNFSARSFYGFSEYWYSMHDALGLGGQYNAVEMTHRSTDFCKTRWSVLQNRFLRKLYPNADKARMRTQCFKSAWLMAVLHDGLGFPKDVGHFRSVNLIDGQEVQWTLGALLYKMRHFPLREIQRLQELEKRQKGILSQRQHVWDYWGRVILVACMIVAAAAAVRYFLILKRIRYPLISRKPVGEKMRRNRSMWGYMMLHEGADAMQGVRVEHSDYVY